MNNLLPKDLLPSYAEPLLLDKNSMEEEAMKCPFQAGNYLLSCKANGAVYVPSLYEFQEYCKSNQYKICPLYLDATTMYNRPAKLVPPRIVKIE